MKLVKKWALGAALIAIFSSTLSIVGISSAQAVTLYMADTDALAFNYSTATKLVGTGKLAGDKVLYKNVGSVGGVAFDALVTTVVIGSGSISDYDNPGSATSNVNNFQLNTTGGEVTLHFEFFLAGTYTGANTGLPVTLQNVRITSIDLDSSSAAGSYQYSDFAGFQKYSMMNPTNLVVLPRTDTNSNFPTPRVRFQAGKAGSRSTVPEDQVLIKYDSMQQFYVNFGNVVAGSGNYFGLAFGGWPNGGTPVEYSNGFNTPPTSTDNSISLDSTSPNNDTLTVSAFGNYADADYNPFNAIEIASLTGLSGTIEYKASGGWTAVTVGQVITTADIDNGKLRYNPTGSSGSSTSFKFYVNDGLDNSSASYTLTINFVAQTNVISFPKPADTGTALTFSAGATSSSGNLVYTSNTPGVCTVNASGQITTVSTGVCSITVSSPASGGYPSAYPITQNFNVFTAGSTTQTITFNNPGSKNTSQTFASGATASSGLAVTLTSLTTSVCTIAGLNITTLTVGDTCTVVASQSGSANGGVTYAAAISKTQSFLVISSSGSGGGGGGGGGGTTPVPYTLGAETLTSSSAYLTGAIDPNGAATAYKFCYLKTSSPSTNTDGSLKNSPTCTSDTNLGDNSTAFQVVNNQITGLSSNNTYSYQIVTWYTASSGTKYYGQVFKFKLSKPYVNTYGTTGSGTSITLTGFTDIPDVDNDKKYSAYYCWVDKYEIQYYGSLKNCLSTTGYGNRTSSINLKNQTANPTIAPSGLQTGKTYYYQHYVKNSDGSVYGNIMRFVIAPVPTTPTPTTLAASNLSSSAVTINGSVTTPSDSTTVGFCWGTSSTLSGCSDVISPSSPFSAAGAKSFSYRLSGISQGTRYYFRAFALTQGASRVNASNILSFIVGSPTVQTLSATNVQKASGSNWSATLNGFINPNGITGLPTFCFKSGSYVVDTTTGKINSCSTLVVHSPSDTMTAQKAFTATLDTFTANTTYYYQAVAANYDTPTWAAYGAVMSFQTIGAPLAQTDAATSITGTSATLNGKLSWNGASTTGTFCLNTNPSALNVPGVLDTCQYTLTTLTGSPASGDSVTVTAATGSQSPAIDLLVGTKYYFQLIGDSSQGTAFGAIKSFTTAAGAPTVTTNVASNIAATSATLNGNTNPKGADTGVKFCYTSSNPGFTSGGTAITGCTKTALVETVTASVVSKDSSINVTGLTSNTTYYYQIQSTNSAGTTYGNVISFKVGAPYTVTDSATVTDSTTATIYGHVMPSGDTITSSVFCLGVDLSNVDSVTGSLNNCVDSVTSSVVPVGIAISSQSEQATLTGLAGGIHYYQLRATNARGTTYGAILHFNSGQPSATTRAATSITSTTATLNGAIDPEGNDDTSGSICINSTLDLDMSGNLQSCLLNDPTAPNSFTGNADVNVNQDVVGLTPGTTYYFQVYAYSMAGNDAGDVLSFSTPASVSFDPNTGTGTMSDQTSDTNTALSANAFTAPSGYHFTGWNTASDGSGDAYGDGDLYDFKSNLYLYAQWSNGCCQISFNSNGGSGSMTPQSVVQNNSANIKSGTYSKSGCTFSGWATSASGAVVYANGDSLTVTTDMTLYAVWTGCPAGGGGGTTPTAQTKETEKKDELPTPKPVVKPVVVPNTGTIKTLAEAKKVIANQIVPVKQEISLAIAPEVKIVQVLINGKTSTATVDENGKITLPAGVLVGPKDKVSVVAETQGEQQTVTVQVKNDPISIGNVNFDFASAKLTAEAKAILKKVATVVKSHGFTTIDLSGHTDVFTSAGFDNQRLSEARNAAVRAYLKQLIPGGVTIKLDGKASTEPIIDSTAAKARAINRRVEIIVK